MGVLVKNGKSYTGTGDLLIQPVIYSDDERCIGVWRDGKPLYQKTIHATLTSTNTLIPLSDIDTFVSINAFGKYTEGSLIQINQFPYYVNTSYFFCGYFSNEDAGYHVQCGQQTLTYYNDFTATIQYTKTTDTAGTAAWVPTGATPIHYSLNEQVIGTWIDGKPLYGRVIYRDDLSIKYSSSEDAKKIDIGSTANVVKYSGYCMYNSSGNKLPLPVYVERGTTLNSDIGSKILPGGKIMIQPGQDYSSDKYSIKIVCLILEYTKTTD